MNPVILGLISPRAKLQRNLVITLLVCNSKNAQNVFKKAIRRVLRKKLNKAKDKGRRILRTYVQRKIPVYRQWICFAGEFLENTS